MKKCTLIWTVFTFTTVTFAQEPLQFIAEIKNEDLAEEAIQLLQCVADRTGTHWELTDSLTGTHSLMAKESADGRLSIRYRGEGKELNLAMARGEFEKVCDAVVPAQTITLTPPVPEDPFPEIQPTPSPRHAWIWAGAAVAVVGGYFLWKSSRKPSYASVTLH